MSFKIDDDEYQEAYDDDGELIGCTDMNDEIVYCKDCCHDNCAAIR